MLGMFLQAGSEPLPPIPDGIFSEAERIQVERANNVERRIKIYETVSERIQKDLQRAISKEEFQTVPDTLKKWTSLLSLSAQDIESNLKAKKKSRPLISYEIQVRKAISSTQECKIRAPVEQQDIFDSSLDQAEKIRKELVEILFQH